MLIHRRPEFPRLTPGLSITLAASILLLVTVPILGLPMFAVGITLYLNRQAKIRRIKVERAYYRAVAERRARILAWKAA